VSEDFRPFHPVNPQSSADDQRGDFITLRGVGNVRPSIRPDESSARTIQWDRSSLSRFFNRTRHLPCSNHACACMRVLGRSKYRPCPSLGEIMSSPGLARSQDPALRLRFNRWRTAGPRSAVAPCHLSPGPGQNLSSENSFSDENCRAPVNPSRNTSIRFLVVSTIFANLSSIRLTPAPGRVPATEGGVCQILRVLAGRLDRTPGAGNTPGAGRNQHL